MRKDKWKRFFKQKQFVLAAGVMVVAAVGMTGVYVSENAAPKQQQMETKIQEPNSKQVKDDSVQVKERETEENTQVQDVSNILLPEVTTDNGAEIAIDTPQAPTEPAAETNEDKAVPTGMSGTNLSFSESSELLWPLKGNVIMNYSMDQTIYYATLDQYKVNPAVIISGNVNDSVVCAADGLITDISTNEQTGCTVKMDLGNGYEAVYGQLKEVPYNKGAFVEAGDVIGYVNEPTKYYSVEGSNLYFELKQNDKPIDPVTFFE